MFCVNICGALTFPFNNGVRVIVATRYCITVFCTDERTITVVSHFKSRLSVAISLSALVCDTFENATEGNQAGGLALMCEFDKSYPTRYGMTVLFSVSV